ncbi:MAG: hypothetical protein ISN29_05445 [Gammaproteobacteria bacterium AqS3]|nr:hypothetical protein [Gammaproteobacteria bacterium AqS3]
MSGQAEKALKHCDQIFSATESAAEQMLRRASNMRKIAQGTLSDYKGSQALRGGVRKLDETALHFKRMTEFSRRATELSLEMSSAETDADADALLAQIADAAENVRQHAAAIR